ncbi:hypothetical protein FRC17_000256 [Serendipita sp. 399]|nr:hypothetical protein FRC17_000256 [Serendipita sp. 399]
MSLPTEILGSIFSHYAQQADDLFPVETLLLVSHSWHNAALAYRKIWSYLLIEIGHIRSIQKWRSRLPMRLERLGPVHPLDITLRNVYSDNSHPASSFANRPSPGGPRELASSVEQGVYQVRHYILNFLQILAGVNGRQAARWRSLKLDFGDQRWECEGDRGQYRFAWKVLSYPTPVLRSLSISNLETYGCDRLFGRSLLPFSPLLESANLTNCSLGCFPDLIAATEVSVSIPGSQGSKSRKLNTGPRTRMLYLRIPLNIHITLRNALHNLRHLKLCGTNLPVNLRTIQAPNLTELTIFPDNSSFLESLAQQNVILSQISQITCLWPSATSFRPELLRDVLSKMHNLDVLKGNRRALEEVLSLLSEEIVTHAADDAVSADNTSLLSTRSLRLQWTEGEGNLSIEPPLSWHAWKSSILESSLLAADETWMQYFRTLDIARAP